MVAVGEAKEACGMEQLCVELDARIKEGIHFMRLLWQQHLQEEDQWFLLIDAQNLFNEENQTIMLREFRYEWPSVVQFTFN